MDILLVSPNGTGLRAMSDNGGGGPSPAGEVGAPVNGLTFNVTDGPFFSLGDRGPLVSGSFNPGFGTPTIPAGLFPPPAPAPPYATQLSAFDAGDVNGTWSLYVNDDFAADTGFIHGGWGLDIVTFGAYDDGPAQFTEDQGSGRINVLANDTGPLIGITDATDAPHGATEVLLSENFPVDPDEVSYQPDPDYCNEPGPAPPDSFTYTITGGDTATVEVDVACTPDPSVANDDATTVLEDSAPNAIDVTANDTDADDEQVEVTAAGDPAHGTATVVQGAPDTVSYKPDADYCNDGAPPDDTFTYTVGGGDTATVSVAVTCVAEPPPPSPTPQTTITKAPRKLKAKGRATATFEFISSVPGSTFSCAIDGASPTPCTSPKAYKLAKGKHTFSVRASAAGKTDASPATATVTVKKKKKRRR